MSALSAKAEPAIALLIESDEDQLFEQLGIRARAIEVSPAVAGEFDPIIVFDGVAMGSMDTVRELGRRIFQRWEKDTYSLICGTGDADEAERQEIANAFGVGGPAVAALIAAGLVSTFGVAPAIGAVVAAIIVKRFLRSAIQEFCIVWGENLNKEAGLQKN